MIRNRLYQTVIFGLSLLFFFPSVAMAQRVEVAGDNTTSSMTDTIAAVVNDSIITTSDIKERMALALMSTGMPPTPEVQQRLFPQVLHGLVDEQLQLQEAKKLDVNVSKEDIDRALERIAHDNGITGDMRSFVREHGGSSTALEDQIKAGIAWSKVVQRELRPRVEVGDDEIDSLIERTRANVGKDEFLVSEIYLTVENPKDEDQIRQAAENLTQQLRSGGNFAAVARQFSQSTGAASGGDISWVQDGQLPTELNQTLIKMKVDEIAGPIRTANGFHILKLREKRIVAMGESAADKDITLELMQVFRPIEATSNKNLILQQAKQLQSDINGCDKLPALLSDKFPSWREQNMGKVSLDKIPSWLSGAISTTAIGKATSPMSTDKGALLVVVCSRHIPEANVDRNAMLNTIGTEKLELQARRLMRDLRREAYIDLRIGK
jgi:peptidyl-prolyl cis-trans isomerase SurA